MGKLLFVNTNRVNGIFGVIICACIAAAGVYLTFFDRNYPAILLIPAGIFGGKFCLKLATLRTELYEHGYASKDIFGSISGRYADLKSVTRNAVRVNGVLNTMIILQNQAGKRLVVQNEKLWKGDEKMQSLLQRSTTDLAETWAKSLERQTEIVWLTIGSTVLKIRKDGVLVEGKDSPGWISLGQLNIKPLAGLDAQILNGDQKVVNTSTAGTNFYVGLALIEILGSKQRSAAAGASS